MYHDINFDPSDAYDPPTGICTCCGEHTDFYKLPRGGRAAPESGICTIRSDSTQCHH